MFPFKPSPFGRMPEHSPLKGDVESKEVDNSGKLPLLCEKDSWDDTPSLFQPLPSYQHQILELMTLESEYLELIRPDEEKPCAHALPTHRIMVNARSRGGVLNATKMKTPSDEAVCHDVSCCKLSTEALIRLAGVRFIQSCSSLNDSHSMLSHPYGSSFSGLSDRETQDIELVQTLLLSAEKVGQQQFERASKLLNWCDALSSSVGNSVQRLVHFFSKALHEKIARETGGITCNGLGKRHITDIERGMMSPNLTMIAVYQELPYIQVGQFVGVQALVDNLTDAKKVHVVDLAIRNGVQSTILMQALASRADRPIEHLKITAIGTKFKHIIEETGDRLKSFAHSINLSFSFNVVMVGDMLDFKEHLLELDPEEMVAIYSTYALWSMIMQPNRLESLIKVIKSINPIVMVILEAAANLNSPNFVNRFIEALIYYSAYFDSLEDCMGRDDENRSITESMFLSKSIWTIVAAEEEERTIRHVKVNVWRNFFTQFGMVEAELSMSSLFQAHLMVQRLACGSSCTFDIDGKSLIIGWKGTPLQSLSAWKFL